MLQEEKDILLHAIDNTEDVLLHRAWSEEAKQRVREARRAGRKVSEMFANLYNSSGRFIYNTAGKATKRFANVVYKKANAARERIQEYRITGHGTNSVTRSKVVKAPKVSKRTQAKLNASRDRIQEQRITGKAPMSAKRTQAKLNASRDRIQEQRITGKSSSTTKHKKTTKRSGSGLTKSAQARLNASRDHIQEQRITGKAPTSAKRTQAKLNASRDRIQEQRITGKTSKTYKTPKVPKRTQAQLNDMRERMQRRRLAGNYDSTTDSFITRKGNSTIYEDASGKGTLTISPRKRKKTTKRSKRSSSGLSKSARARLNASRDRIQQYRITGR